jgi:nucleotide-binding universal stress UspA family protein
MLEDGGSEDPIIERKLKAERDEEIEEWEDKLKADTRKIFDRYKKQLVDSGIPASCIKTKVIERKHDVGKAIVNAAKRGGFTTIVLGRRGVTFLQELALGSVSYRVVKLAKNCTVWVVH